MTYSLCLSFINARHFKSPIDIWGNFVPGMVFFQSIFGYLVFTIIYKWSIDWVGQKLEAPGLLNMLIYMFLQPGTVEEPSLYRGQAVVQVILLLIAVTCVPILLLLKPLYLRWENNNVRAQGYRGIGETSRFSALDAEDDDGHAMNGGRESMGSDREAVAMITQDLGEGEHEEFEFSEVMIHQTIHTIGKIVEVFNDDDDMAWLIRLRILPQLCFPYGVVPSAMGPLARTSTAVNRFVEHDAWQCIRIHWSPWSLHDSCVLLCVVFPYHRYSVRDGRHKCHVTQFETALG